MLTSPQRLHTGSLGGDAVQATQIPSWTVIVALAMIPLAMAALGLLGRRLRVTEPELWEKLGKPLAPRTEFTLAASIAVNVAAARLLLFPFQRQSFGSSDAYTNLLLGIVRGAVGLGLVLAVWAWVGR